MKATYSAMQEMNSGVTDLKHSTALILRQVVENGRILTENVYDKSQNHCHITPTKNEFGVVLSVESDCFSSPTLEYKEPDELEL